jgi:hypothetical protein
LKGGFWRSRFSDRNGAESMVIGLLQRRLPVRVPAWRARDSRLCLLVNMESRTKLPSRMIIGLSRTRRLRAGWIVALTYLLCVLAPTLSFALPGSRAVTPCLTEAAHGPGMVHLHTDTPIQHVRVDGHVHDHASVHLQASSGDFSMMAINDKSVPEKAPHSFDGQCCGLTCVTALPATLIDIVKPSAPTALCEVEGYRKVADNGPPRLYRPPIS